MVDLRQNIEHRRRLDGGTMDPLKKAKEVAEHVEGEVLEEVGKLTGKHDITFKGQALEHGEHVERAEYHGKPEAD
ncbi:MAG TPA: hypothetical protein DCQ04_03215 [Actinobacteria bacterium]|nr:hypothetical protein [Actinomycetota bacterium]